MSTANECTFSALEDWAVRAGELIQEYIDDAEASAGNETLTAQIERALLDELNKILGSDHER